MGSLTKTERNRIHKVRERDRVRKQIDALKKAGDPEVVGVPIPPLHDPDVLGRGPGTGPSPRGASAGDAESKPTAAEVARETRQGFNARWEPVPSLALVETERGTFELPEKKEGDIRPPSKQVMRDIHAHKVTSRETNVRGPVDVAGNLAALAAADAAMPGANLLEDRPEPRSENAQRPVNVETKEPKKPKKPTHRAILGTHVPPGVGEPRAAKKEARDADAG